jgi:hypothetical protein
MTWDERTGVGLGVTPQIEADSWQQVHLAIADALLPPTHDIGEFYESCAGLF